MTTKASANKYHAQKTTVDGMKFDSKAEARRWQELKILERAGQIQELRRQVIFKLLKAVSCRGKVARPTTYIADFVYNENGIEIIEDTKGMLTKEFLLKEKMMKAILNKDIRVTK